VDPFDKAFHVVAKTGAFLFKRPDSLDELIDVVAQLGPVPLYMRYSLDCQFQLRRQMPDFVVRLDQSGFQARGSIGQGGETTEG
jgi:hypothetical protein